MRPPAGDFIAKRIEILRDLFPAASKMAIMVNPGNPIHTLVLANPMRGTAQKLAVLTIVEATTAEELEIAFTSAAAKDADAMKVFGDPALAALRSCGACGEASLTAIY